MGKLDPKTGIEQAAVSYEVVDAYLKKLGLSTDGNDYARLLRLHEAMQLVPTKNKLGNCNKCRGKSHIDLSCCPFCGDGEVDESVVKARSSEAPDPEAIVIAQIRDLIAAKNADDEKKREEVAAKERAAAEKRETTAGQALVALPPGKGGRAKKGKAEQQTLPIEAPDTQIVKADEKRLNECVERFTRHIGDAAVSVYDAGVVLLEVYEQKLFLQRRGADGQPLYDSFTKWVSSELSGMKISPQYAYELTNLPKYFTREQVSKIGPTKLNLSLRIEESERKRLLEAGSLETMTVKDVKEQIRSNPATAPRDPERAANAPQGRVPTPGARTKKNLQEQGAAAVQAEQEKTANKPAPMPPPDQKPRVVPEQLQLVTAVLPSVVQQVMIARKRDEKGKKRFAADISDDPTAVITCANGAKLTIGFFKDPDGKIQVMVRTDSPTKDTDEEDDEE